MLSVACSPAAVSRLNESPSKKGREMMTYIGQAKLKGWPQ